MFTSRFSRYTIYNIIYLAAKKKNPTLFTYVYIYIYNVLLVNFSRNVDLRPVDVRRIDGKKLQKKPRRTR